eukprot:2532755-Prymnesium_polylepis.1
MISAAKHEYTTGRRQPPTWSLGWVSSSRRNTLSMAGSSASMVTPNCLRASSDGGNGGLPSWPHGGAAHPARGSAGAM